MTATGTSADFLTQGPAHLYVATWGATLPTFTNLAALVAGTFTGFTDCGETTAALEVTDTPTWVDVTTQQQSRVVDSFISKIETKIKTTLAESTAQRLADLCRGAVVTADSVSTYTPSGLGFAPKLSIAAVGPWPGGENVLIVAERVIYDAALTVAFDTGKATEYAVEFKVLIPSTADGAPSDGWVIYTPGVDS